MLYLSNPRIEDSAAQQLASGPSQQEWPPHGLVSLWHMLSFNAKAFYDSARYLERMQMAAFYMDQGVLDQPVSPKMREDMLRELGKLVVGCDILGARLTAMAAKRLCEQLEAKSITIGQNADLLKNVAERFKDEISKKSLLVMSEDDAPYFSNPVSLFGESVASLFPSAMPDLEEAGKCLAVDRPTAAVFHLMRALEVPLQIFARELLPNDVKPNWDPIIKKIDLELKLPHEKRAIKGNVEFWANVSAHMHAVKLAWRNKVAHIDVVVSKEKARDIFSSTRSLLSYLAEGLPESMRSTGLPDV